MIISNLIRLQFGDRDKRLRAVKDLGKSRNRLAVPFLAAAIKKDSHVWVRREAVGALAEIRGAGTYEPIVAALRHSDWEVRLEAVCALGRIGDARAFEPLAATLKDESGLVRQGVPSALAKIGGQRAVQSLVAAVKDRDEEVRQAALRALANVAAPQAAGVLLEALRDASSNVRRTAVRLLGDMPDRSSLGALVGALKDRDRETQHLVMQTLAKIDPRWVESPEMQRALPEFLSAVGGEDADMRTAAANLLAVIPTADIAPLVAALSSKHASVRREMATALKVRGWKPETTEESISLYLAQEDWQALVKLGEAAFEFCLRAGQDKDRERRAPALKALCQFSPRPFVSRLEELLCPGRNEDVRAELFRELVENDRIDLDQKNLCRKYLKDKNPTLRSVAARRLGKAGEREDLEPLIEYLLDGGSVYNKELVTMLGGTLRKGNIDRGGRAAILKCMNILASRGDEEAAAVLWLLERGQ
jgi:HEAT repeat protein